MVLTPDDFNGEYTIHQGIYNNGLLESYIESTETKILNEMFGATLCAEFLSDLDGNGVPKSPNFQAVFNPFAVDKQTIGGESLLMSKGVKDMLKGFVFFYYLRDQFTKVIPGGEAKQAAQNSGNIPTTSSQIWKAYNNAIATYKAIRYKVVFEPDNYKVGQVVESTCTNIGDGYETGGVITINALGGTGFQLTIDEVDENGGILAYTVVSVGIGYALNQQLTVPGGNGNAVIKATYVGKGNFNNWRGIEKDYANYI